MQPQLLTLTKTSTMPFSLTWAWPRSAPAPFRIFLGKSFFLSKFFWVLKFVWSCNFSHQIFGPKTKILFDPKMCWPKICPNRNLDLALPAHLVISLIKTVISKKSWDSKKDGVYGWIYKDRVFFCFYIPWSQKIWVAIIKFCTF